MMYIMTPETQSKGAPSPQTWHIGNPKPDHYVACDVVEVQADGDELIHILTRFDNLPRIAPEAKGQLRIWRWFGDYAKFIVGNL